jgi:hypothetical protein
MNQYRSIDNKLGQCTCMSNGYSKLDLLLGKRAPLELMLHEWHDEGGA